MLRVKCIDTTNSTALVAGQIYYAFPVNESKKAAYISKFNNETANFGCFQMSRFKVLDGSFEQLKLF